MINMIIIALIEMAIIKILILNMILMFLINMVIMFMIIEKNQVKLKLAKQNLLKIKKEKDTLIYVFFCLNSILIRQSLVLYHVVQKN